jgi:hypothetical protein
VNGLTSPRNPEEPDVNDIVANWRKGEHLEMETKMAATNRNNTYDHLDAEDGKL